ncbi:hypothetical protein FRB99_008025 [Tulasnella sp. 403]|nr:hypothetical protein FRB99_008025 [Tulasnella sp. 403]
MSSPSSSSAASTSPAPPPTPLTPNSAHVSFAPQADQQFAFDGLSLENTTPTGVAQAPATNGGAVRRKPSRRANTAERRATHNAVERQRRETLNGRFLDLAALLPNLATVRRPSKSAIVNSSIALIHTQRRARVTAARELRLLKQEADALRNELNTWRERAGMNLPRIEEPPRSREFEELVSGALEEAEEGILEEERRANEIALEGLRMDASGYPGDMIQNPFAFNMSGAMFPGLAEDDDDDSSDGQPARIRPGSQGSVNSLPSLSIPAALPRQNAMNANPMIYDPNANMLQAHPTHQAGINAFPSFDMAGAPQLGLGIPPAPKAQPVWNNQVFGSLPQYGQQQMYPSPTSHNGTFLGGLGLRDDDATDASSTSSASIADLTPFNFQQPIAPRTRSASTLAALQTSLKAGGSTPPSSAPPTATTYAEAASAAGDAFSAAYAAYPRVAGGGNTYGAAMGLFM